MPETLNLARYCLAGHAADPASAARPAFTFVTDDGERSWTYAELWEQVERIGRGLLARGLAPGDRVLLRLPHSPQYALAFFGATAAGLVPIPSSPQLTEQEAAFFVDDAEPAAIITTAGMRLPHFDGVELLAGDLDALDGAVPLPETDAEDPAFLIYTSGTTSHPKGVVHAHRSIHGRALMREGWQDFRPSDVTLHAGLLNWSYTLGVGLMDPWAAGAHATLFGGEPDPAGWPRLIERLGVTVFTAVPTIYRQMLKYGHPEDADLSSLRHGLVAAEPLPPALRDEWRRRGGTELYESLGMTELSTYISSGPSTPVRPGSPGRPQPGRRVAILPEDGGEDGGDEPLPPGEVGLLAVHRTDPGLMLGYWRRPEEEAAVFRGEWFTGGDLAAIDEDGYVWFHGRADDVIKSFGYRLSPVEIEAALLSCPGVAEVAVVGLTIEEGKTLVTACAVPEPGATVDERALAAHAAEHLAEYKRPHAYRLLESLPRAATGKLQRSTLVERLLAES
ncbi:MAG: class I adenylate-forming enzyme family protein [Dehalococcoidia bacterium]